MNKTLLRITQAMTVTAAVILATPPVLAHSDDEGGPSSFGQPGKPSEVDRTVKIDMKNMRFAPERINVAVGETIRFVVSNSDQAEHELVIGDAESQAEHRKEMAGMHMGNSMQHQDPNAITIGAGQTKTLIWRFTRAGGLEFDCNIPGHYESGMKGVINVAANASGN